MTGCSWAVGWAWKTVELRTLLQAVGHPPHAPTRCSPSSTRLSVCILCPSLPVLPALQVLCFLCKAGADVSRADCFGDTLLHHCCRHMGLPSVQALVEDYKVRQGVWGVGRPCTKQASVHTWPKTTYEALHAGSH